MESNGWIKLHRSITHHWLWSDSTKLGWWLDLLFMANWKDKRVVIGTSLVEVKRGQMIASNAFLCDRWGVSRNTVRNFLRLLEVDNMLTISLTHKKTILTICNYDKYQLSEDEALTPSLTPSLTPIKEISPIPPIKNIEEISLTQDACACIYNNGSEVSDIERLYQEYRDLILQPKSKTSISFQRRYKKSPSELSGYLDDFQDELRAEGTQPTRTRSDYRRYFLAYLSRRIEKEQRQQATKTNGKTGQYKNDAERRLHNAGNFSGEPLADF